MLELFEYEDCDECGRGVRAHSAVWVAGVGSWFARCAPTNRIEPSWGKPYGGDAPYITPRGARRWMYRKGQRVRFYDRRGRQVGPEHSNVAPAICYAMHYRWSDSAKFGGLTERDKEML
jgi:hypothetical protein